ncbi:MAG TPA: fructosamine kinase family protein [Candidatus Anaerostipes excrementavium]|uniref:Fructosamine kinase family protein n=1 Tax=Candidatus Anaerostipes excrementavium TaxID=2838463 RepID=A0A9D1WVV2_9FIRM|nr:fructosamine kinase family protein [uncultured Anaerostipes sp.]HIX66995.1 fructosamine kinase family protein [Candidatus Anaerostipes excrementavium]
MGILKQDYGSMEEAIWELYGSKVSILKEEPVYGGDINDACKITLSTGQKVFVKRNSAVNHKFFTTEALGLYALKETGEIGVPEILAGGVDVAKGISFLMMEYLESVSKREDYWETFGHQLAMVHQAECRYFVNSKEGCYGFLEDNFIGAAPQKNTPKGNWIDFYRECRLLPQIQMAKHYFTLDTLGQFEQLLEHLEDYLREPEFPSLLHGDLWGGNVICGNDGRAWLIDPAVYVGDFETDLAMTQLFGSFPARFYGAYHEINPIPKEYDERRDLYQLYHLLNHLNLFGRSYLRSVIGILEKYVSGGSL